MDSRCIMPNAANEPRRYSPWPEYDPPADLPDDLKGVYRRAAAPVMIAESFCSIPERFDFSLEALSSWYDPLRQTRNELAGWMTAHEAEQCAEAPEVL